MSRPVRRWIGIAVGVLIVIGAAVAIIYVSGRPPSGPVEIVWDEEVCAECRMHVGERGFAVQLQTEGGEVLVFDDPGCALVYIDRTHPRIHALYFHHLEEDRWIAERDVAFVPVESSPMGYQLGAVDRAAGSVSLAQAREQVLSLARARGGAP